MDTSIINSVTYNYMNLFSFQIISNIVSSLFVMEMTSPQTTPISQNSAKKSTCWSEDSMPTNGENTEDCSKNHSVNGKYYIAVTNNNSL